MNVLVNSLGIQDSGGITVLEKLLEECASKNNNTYIIVCNRSSNMSTLLKKYINIESFRFKVIDNRSFLFRMYYENYVFRSIISSNNIDLIYNFSGTGQFFIKIPQLIKIQNLLFFSKKLDFVYQQSGLLKQWVKQIFLKRIVFRLMLIRKQNIEIQSSHVKEGLSNFINTENKRFFIKSDIDVKGSLFQNPRQYNFTKKINILYIVGPHFEFKHKNFIDFVSAMVTLNSKGFDFTINITLTKEELGGSQLWDSSLNDITNFLGYISDRKKIGLLFTNNTILISTSIIETLGLHVIEAIKNGVIAIAPNVSYVDSVYGKNMLKYNLFDSDSLVMVIASLIGNKYNCKNIILSLQQDLIKSEKSKYESILDIFNEVIND